MIWLAVSRADPALTPAVAPPTLPHAPILVSAAAARAETFEHFMGHRV